MSLVKITKRYGQVVSHDYQSWEFMTEMTKEVEVTSGEQLLTECEKLAKNVRVLTEADINKVQQAIKPQELK